MTTQSLPKNWVCSIVTKVATVIMGQSPDSRFVNDEEVGIPFLQGNAEFTDKYPAHIHWVTKPTKLSEKSDILISVRAPVGELNIADKEYCIGRGLAAIRFSEVDNQFGWYAIAYHKDQLSILAQGSTFAAVSSKDFSNFEITYPTDPAEQHAIADILSTLDEAIAQSESLVRKYQSIKQGLMSDLLTRGVDENGELRSKWEEAPKLYRETSLGWLPKVWEVTELRNLASVERGKFTPRPRNNPKYYNGEFPFIQTGEVAAADGRRIKTYTQTLNQLGTTVSREFPRETIVVTIAANIGETAILDIPMYLTDSLVGIVVQSPNNVRFIEMLVRSQKEHFNAIAPQSAQKNINLGDLRPMLIARPEPKEQNRIAEIYETTETTLINEEKNLTKFQLLKQGLMQDLLSGQVRVKKLE